MSLRSCWVIRGSTEYIPVTCISTAFAITHALKTAAEIQSTKAAPRDFCCASWPLCSPSAGILSLFPTGSRTSPKPCQERWWQIRCISRVAITHSPCHLFSFSFPSPLLLSFFLSFFLSVMIIVYRTCLPLFPPMTTDSETRRVCLRQTL